MSLDELLINTGKVPGLNNFLKKQKIDLVWISLIKNVDKEKFISQFHRWFDGLKTIKFLKYYSKTYE